MRPIEFRDVAAGLLAIAACCTAAPVAAMDVARAIAPAERTRQGDTAEMQSADTVEAGDHLQTGVGGHLKVQLGLVGQLTLGSQTSVFVHSADSPAPGRMYLVRAVLDHGALRVDTRSATSQFPPADVRLNVGTLRMRIFGAEIWVRHTDDDEVCLLAGAVELQTPAGSRRLDQKGSCLSSTAAGVRISESADVGSLAARLALTAFPDEYRSQLAMPRDPAPPPAPAAERQTPPKARKPDSDDALTKALARIPPAGPPAPAPMSSNWTIVLASMSDPIEASQEAARLRRTGLQTRVIETSLQNGGTAFRVTHGEFASKTGAQSELRRVRSMPHLAKAWLTPLR